MSNTFTTDCLRTFFAEHPEFEPEEFAVAVTLTPDDKNIEILDRTNILLNAGDDFIQWHCESLRKLFKGNEVPLPEEEISQYPDEYLPFFYEIENSVITVYDFVKSRCTDDDFIEIYSAMRRRPDGKSIGLFHDIVWQAACLALVKNDWSEKQYTAMIRQLERSARKFHFQPGSKNYLRYILNTVG